MDKTYLGNGAYVEHDGCRLILTAENGVSVTDRIVLELRTLEAFRMYADAFERAVMKAAAQQMAERVADDMVANAEPTVILPPPGSVQGTGTRGM